jgi:4-amino-4-deoxy-L-arabinose transferase-like glycosyltransferase
VNDGAMTGGATSAGYLVRLSRVRGIAWYIALLATTLSVAFTFALYPAIVDSQHAVLDPDLHGPLGFGIWKLHSFSYYPRPEASAARGPLYPLFIAGLLAATDGWWPYSVQLAQCILFGLMCVLVFWTARVLWSAPAAVLAAGLCAVDPFLIWYTSRIWVEPMMMFLFTALIACIVLLKQGPTPRRAALVGLILGASVMTKSVYTPFLILTPLLLLLPFGKRLSVPLAAIVLIVGLATIAPWTLRNGRVTGHYAPEVGNTGFTLHQGNDFVEDFAKAPFSVSALYVFSLARMREEADEMTFAPGSTGLQKHNVLDATRQRTAIDKLVKSPGFFVKKIIYDLFLFWTFGDSPGKSMFIALLQLPLLAFFCVALVKRRRELLHGALGICAALICLFYFAHLPTIALARYSVVLVPAMLIVAVGSLGYHLRTGEQNNVELIP